MFSYSKILQFWCTFKLLFDWQKKVGFQSLKRNDTLKK